MPNAVLDFDTKAMLHEWQSAHGPEMEAYVDAVSRFVVLAPVVLAHLLTKPFSWRILLIARMTFANWALGSGWPEAEADTVPLAGNTYDERVESAREEIRTRIVECQEALERAGNGMSFSGQERMMLACVDEFVPILDAGGTVTFGMYLAKLPKRVLLNRVTQR